MTFRPHPLGDERRRSAMALVELLLREQSALLSRHLNECLSLAIWKFTEADGKYTTRFRSVESSSADPKELRHDHVFQRKKMIDDLKAHPEAVNEILSKAIGCTITKDEHTRLDECNHLDGWGRYRQAGIVIIDWETGKPLQFPV